YRSLEADLAICLQSIALLHDFGNPPFGHFGEDVIKNYFSSLFSKKKNNLTNYEKTIIKTIKNRQMINDCRYFDGNAQGFRIVTKLQTFKTPGQGLDLTYGVLGGLFKYPYSSEY